MIRFLLYTCDLDVCAVIEPNSIFQRNGQSKEDWYENQQDAYEQIYPNLIKHNSNYPKADELRSIVLSEIFSSNQTSDFNKLKIEHPNDYKRANIEGNHVAGPLNNCKSIRVEFWLITIKNIFSGFSLFCLIYR